MTVELLVVGAADSMGRVITEKALAAGHTVTAYVDDPGATMPAHDHLAIMRGDVTDPGALLEATAGKDAVIFTPGVGNRRTTTVFSEGIFNVVHAMEAKGVRRVLALSTTGLEPTSQMPIVKRMFAVWILERMMRNIYLDLARMEDELELSDTDWTVIRAAQSGRPATGRFQVSAAGSGGARDISRHDVADYLLAHVADWETYQKKLLLSPQPDGRGSVPARP